MLPLLCYTMFFLKSRFSIPMAWQALPEGVSDVFGTGLRDKALRNGASDIDAGSIADK